jgi:hypothetical protein
VPAPFTPEENPRESSESEDFHPAPKENLAARCVGYEFLRDDRAAEIVAGLCAPDAPP